MWNRWKQWTGLAVIVMAAVFMEAILAFQYNYARNELEKELESSAMMNLTASSLRIQEVLSNAESVLSSQILHAERHVRDSRYMRMLIREIVQYDEDNLIGAVVAFRPYYYPEYGYWCELYARQTDSTIVIEQIGSPEHDYFQRDFFLSCMAGETFSWTKPYYDGEGAQAMVTSHVLPLYENGETVGVLGVDMRTIWIDKVVNAVHSYPSSFSLVLSEDGELISSPPDSMVSAALVQKIVSLFNGDEKKLEWGAQGKITHFPFYDEEKQEVGRVYCMSRQDVPRWDILFVCYDDELFGKLEKLRGYMFILAMLGLAVLSLIVWLFIRENRKRQATELSQVRIKSELRIAKDIQLKMLPDNNADAMRSKEFGWQDVGICGALLPAREVGGDLYDYFMKDAKLFFAVGDVSGKGVPAAMMMAQTMSLLRSSAPREHNPARTLRALNETLCRGNDTNMFVTLFIGVLDLPTGQLRYCNAGHDRPLRVQSANASSSDGIQMIEANPHLPVGVFENTQYEAQEMQLEAGDMLFLYTDGLTEAKNEQRQQFGLQRALEQLRACAAQELTPQQVIEDMQAGVKRFVNGAEQSDDLTMLAIRYSPQHFNISLSETLQITNDVREVSRLNAFMKSVFEKMNIGASEANRLRLAIEEAVVNVIDYAYPAGETGEIDIRLLSDGQKLKVIIRDNGVPFDPTVIEETDTSLSAEERQIGGLGILLVRELMDTINYERIDGQNILTLIKDI